MARKLTLSQMRSMSKDYFWSPATMKFFREARPKYSAVYDDRTGKNYIVVQKDSRYGGTAYYEFDEASGKTNCVENPFEKTFNQQELSSLQKKMMKDKR